MCGVLVAKIGEGKAERSKPVTVLASLDCAAIRPRRGQDKANSADFACATKARLSLDCQKLGDVPAGILAELVPL